MTGSSDLERLLDAAAPWLRPTDTVMAPAQLGAARLTRFSFNRSMIRRAFGRGWAVSRSRFDLDAEGRGVADYRVDAEGHVVHFVAFTTTLDESCHTDRVVADAWEVTGALVEPGTDDGEIDDTFLAQLAASVPLQEDARLDGRTLVLTRGNRSVRFFASLVDALAAGQQPDPDLVGDAGYIMRSTAFYANGKYGMRSFDGAADHPLAAPYRAQMLAAWLFRELSYDVVEHCAAARGGTAAVGFDDDWRTYFGLGNATGLGLVPYAFNHPDVLHTWAAVRELALANVRRLPPDADRLATMRRWAERAVVHFAPMGSDGRAPWLAPARLAAIAERLVGAVDDAADDPRPFDSIYRWAEADGPEACEMIVSMLIELDDTITDDHLDRLLVVEPGGLAPGPVVDPAMPAQLLLQLVDDRFGWIDDAHVDGPGADHFWWAVSDNTDEPRRVERSDIDPAHRDVAIDIALRVRALRGALVAASPGATVGDLLAAEPDHALAVARVVAGGQRYGEPHDNACSRCFLPLNLQRFQLAMYGMDNFAPKSTDWLRVTLNQGAPRAADLARRDHDDEWVWPRRPARTGQLR